MLRRFDTWLERLRKQPLEMKSQVALIGAVVVTTLFALVWVTTLPARFSSLSSAGSTVREGVTETISESPIGQEALLQDAFTPGEPEPDVRMTEEEQLRARVDALIQGTSRTEKKAMSENGSVMATGTDSEPVSRPGAPVRIETR